MEITKEKIIQYYKARIIDYHSLTLNYVLKGDYKKYNSFTITPEEGCGSLLSVSVSNINDEYYISMNSNDKFKLSYDEFFELKSLFVKYEKIMDEHR